MPPHFEPTLHASNAPLEHLLVRAADCLRALLHDPTCQAGLNESRFNVLDLLREAPAGCCSQNEIAARLFQSESNISTLLDRMHNDGLVSRMRSRADRRRVTIGLTPAGEEALTQADRNRGKASTAALQPLDEPEQSALRLGLERLVHCLELALGNEPQRHLKSPNVNSQLSTVH